MNKSALIDLNIIDSKGIHRGTINELIIYIGIHTWIS